jgi:hypothetical protein
VRCLFYLAVVIRRFGASTAPLAFLLCLLARHGCLPCLIVFQIVTKRQASPMIERDTRWSMQSSVLRSRFALQGYMSASGSRGNTSAQARSRPPRRRRRRQDVVLSRIRFDPASNPSARWRNSCRSCVPSAWAAPRTHSRRSIPAQAVCFHALSSRPLRVRPAVRSRCVAANLWGLALSSGDHVRRRPPIGPKRISELTPAIAWPNEPVSVLRSRTAIHHYREPRCNSGCYRRCYSLLRRPRCNSSVAKPVTEPCYTCCTAFGP